MDESSTRQPGVHPGAAIPADVYTEEICAKVVKLTEDISKLLTEYINKPKTDGKSENVQQKREQKTDKTGTPPSNGVVPDRVTKTTSHFSPKRTTMRSGARVSVSSNYGKR